MVRVERRARDAGRGTQAAACRSLRAAPVAFPFFLFPFLIAVTATPLAAQTDEVGLPLGTVPEAVVIEDLDGNDVDLAQYIGGKPTLFQFWAHWCEQCEQLKPAMEAAHEKYGDRVNFIAVSVAINQSKRSIKRHLEKSPTPHVVLWDTRGRAVRAFKAPTTSYVVVLDADGRVAYTGVGPDQDVDMAIRRVVDET